MTIDPSRTDLLRRGAAAVLASVLMACVPEPVAAPTEEEEQADEAAEPTSEAPPPPAFLEEEVTIRSGSVITTILQKYGLDYPGALAVVQAAASVHDLAKIRAGESIRVRTLPYDGRFLGLIYPLDRFGERFLVVEKNAWGSFVAREDARPVKRVPIVVAGTVHGSLWATGMAMGLSAENLVALAGIFEWQIDFNTQIRPGDRFRMTIERVDDAETQEALRLDTILVAEYQTAAGTSFVGVRYEGADAQVGYFDAEGRASKQMFLKSPLKFSRVSSRFGNRYHPVLKTWRAHKGTDFAAGEGTPIRAIGRGTVSFLGIKGGYGKHVRVNHGGKYASSYSHLSRYAVRAGATVDQGEVIGYVGSTGLATGPHLHFEFYANDKQVDFLRQQFPRSEPIADSERVAFDALRDRLLPPLLAVPFPGRAVDAVALEPELDGEPTSH